MTFRPSITGKSRKLARKKVPESEEQMRERLAAQPERHRRSRRLRCSLPLLIPSFPLVRCSQYSPPLEDRDALLHTSHNIRTMGVDTRGLGYVRFGLNVEMKTPHNAERRGRGGR